MFTRRKRRATGVPQVYLHRPDTCTPETCPTWISEQAGFMETNVQTGEERFITGCFYQVIPRLMVEVIKASNRPAAAVESTRNVIAEGFTRLTRHMANLPALVEEQRVALERPSGDPPSGSVE